MPAEQLYSVSGMHCQGCARKLEAALREYSDVAEIDFPSALVRMRNPTASVDELNARLSELGSYMLTAANQSEQEIVALPAAAGLKRYFPLLLIAAYLTAGSFAAAATPSDWMRHFMAGFFLVFSFFKLLNVRAFTQSYAMYDLIAGRWKGYGLVYPFIELGLGFAYLFGWQMRPVLSITLALMIISGIGVVRSMTRRQTIRCACLGAVLDVPVSTVTVIEDFGMAIMAALMLAFNH
jgi:copper chaperone CopZ